MSTYMQDELNVRQNLKNNCSFPQHYYIDIGNYCNLRCPFCVTGAGEGTAKKGFMSLDNFSVIFNKIKGHAKLIALYNWGEPFLNREVLEIIRVAKGRSIKVHIDSNLSMKEFTDEYCDRIVESGLYSLFASVDGVTQGAYETYRVRGNVDRVFRNIKRLNVAKLRAQSEYPIIGWQFHVSAFNEHEMAAAEEKAAKMGVGIVFKRLNSPDPKWWSTLHEQSQMVLKGLEWFNRTYSPQKNEELSKLQLHPAMVNPCSQLFGTMTIAWDGEVMPCTCVEGPAYSMGNMLTSSLAEVWNGSEFRKSREFVLNFGPLQHTGSVCERLTCPIVNKVATQG